jgi:hypothetical protein
VLVVSERAIKSLLAATYGRAILTWILPVPAKTKLEISVYICSSVKGGPSSLLEVRTLVSRSLRPELRPYWRMYSLKASCPYYERRVRDDAAVGRHSPFLP